MDGGENEGKLPLDKMEGRGGHCRVQTVRVGVDCVCRPLSVLISLCVPGGGEHPWGSSQGMSAEVHCSAC